MEIRVMDPDEGLCPGCGEQGPAKVCNNGEGECGHWSHKCKTADCPVGWYDPHCGTSSPKLTPEESAEMAARVEAEVEAMCAGKTWVNVSPEGAWYETWVLQ